MPPPLPSNKHEHALGAQAERLAATGRKLSAPSLGSAVRTGEREETLAPGLPALVVAAAYAAVGATAAAVAILFGRNPIAVDGWLGTRGWAALLLSLGLGMVLGSTTIAVTPAMVSRWRWARALHLALRPAAHGVGNPALLLVAIASATGEELLFRGLLVPIIGVTVSSLAFGLMHQIGGRGRWWWMAWATVMGLLFGEIYAMTGSLVGPLLAHGAINYSNLRFLRDNDPTPPPPRALGGLLRR